MDAGMRLNVSVADSTDEDPSPRSPRSSSLLPVGLVGVDVDVDVDVGVDVDANAEGIQDEATCRPPPTRSTARYFRSDVTSDDEATRAFRDTLCIVV